MLSIHLTKLNRGIMKIKYLAAIIVIVTVNAKSYQSEGYTITNKQALPIHYSELIEMRTGASSYFKRPVIS